MRFRLYSLLILFSLMSKMHAQEYEKINGVWNALFLDYALSDKFSLRNEFHLRTVSYLEVLNQQMIRPSITYTTPKKVKWSGGYSFFRNFDRNIDAVPRVRIEHNLWSQILYKLPLTKGSISTWLRLEHRFQEVLPLQINSKSFDFSSRLRFRVTYERLLSKPEAKTPAHLVFYDEIFTLLNPQGIPYKFNQNWTFFGMKLKFNEKMTLISGFQKNTIAQSGGNFLKNRLWNTLLFYKL
ncbi:MAG: DUF2490 domain-containing protein [Flavobacteriaceae bacterium]